MYASTVGKTHLKIWATDDSGTVAVCSPESEGEDSGSGDGNRDASELELWSFNSVNPKVCILKTPYFEDWEPAHATFSADGRSLLLYGSSHPYRPSNWGIYLFDIGEPDSGGHLLGEGFGLLRNVSFNPEGIRVMAGSDNSKARQWFVDNRNLESLPLIGS